MTKTHKNCRSDQTNKFTVDNKSPGNVEEFWHLTLSFSGFCYRKTIVRRQRTKNAGCQGNRKTYEQEEQMLDDVSRSCPTTLRGVLEDCGKKINTQS
ncbi:hypothetical protein CEXT_775891 [Caerostris extrusa]|uniref:Uncharacterized protein n=1 Tax=Caerostris extrusa TaxID=172846 RepID=A0AAV4WU56_CAEEX|nr:hypothetical protein CEXT_775891 [Caerostris extrusa]